MSALWIDVSLRRRNCPTGYRTVCFGIDVPCHHRPPGDAIGGEGGILSLARRQQIGDGVHGGYAPLVDGEIAGSAATDL
jgi:hypothetical protein